jgi:ABC-2 type transport system permease protein
MNPMIRKELQQRMRERRGWLIPTLYLLVFCAVIVLIFSVSTGDNNRRIQGAEIGLILFASVSYTQLALLLLFAPVFSAGSLTIEKEQRTYPSLLTSLLTSSEIWWGKLSSSLLYVLLLLVTALPVLSMAFAFGGVGLREAILMTITTIIVLVTVSAIGLFCSSAFRRSVHATAATYGLVIFMSAVTAIIFFVGLSRYHFPGGWQAIPWAVRMPMYFNPFFFITMSFAPEGHLYPYWTNCLLAFAGMAAVAAMLTLFNLKRDT